MRIVGYYIHGKREYVAFEDEKSIPAKIKITDGFHDRVMDNRNIEKWKAYCQVERKDIDVGKIVSRMRGARPWHPLLRTLTNKKEREE